MYYFVMHKIREVLTRQNRMFFKVNGLSVRQIMRNRENDKLCNNTAIHVFLYPQELQWEQ